ncbi:Monocarboxylate transporter 7 [Oryzias melastigma]|uniref:Monocarboxylate transporter 7 n=1 Tax=Oryzias melastigma TaxID=30732 RepID=A0A834CH66_ORYME|nr:Monocarboxylate transporter 7 [Oryzias melastigma]
MTLCRLKDLKLLGPNKYSAAPDGGWGWAVAAAFFLVEIFTYGTIKIFGIFLLDLMKEFEESNSRVSWIVSIAVFVMTFNGPLASVMTNRFGYQFVVMVGGLLICSGTIATGFTTSVNQIYLTYGLVAGLGYCLTFLPTVTILSKYFSRRRSLVVAVASTGESLSLFALAPAYSAIRDQIGWRHTMMLIGALQSIVIVCGVLLRPIIIEPREPDDTDANKSFPKELEALQECEHVEGSIPEDCLRKEDEMIDGYGSTGVSDLKCLQEETNALLQKDGMKEAELKPERASQEKDETNRDVEKQIINEKSSDCSKLLDFSILRECSFILYSLFGLFATLGFFAPPLYVIELSVSHGVERDRAAFMLSIMAVAEILGRFFIGWILSRRLFSGRKLLVLLACVLVMTLDLVGFTLVKEFYGLAVCCALYGFFMGTISCTHIPLLAEDDVVGIERMNSAGGVYVFIQSFAGLAGPPLGGVLVDVTNNYGAAFYSCAIGMGLSALFLGLVRPAKNGMLCRRGRSKHSALDPQNKDGCEEQSGEQRTEIRSDCLNNSLQSGDRAAVCPEDDVGH